MRKITKKIFAAILALSLFAGFSASVASFAAENIYNLQQQLNEKSEALNEYLESRREDFIRCFTVIPTRWFDGERIYEIFITLTTNDTILAKVDLNDTLDDDYELQIFHLQSYDEENPEIPETLFWFKTLDMRQEAINNGYVLF